MKKFEYKAIESKSLIDDYMITSNYGDFGWELVTIILIEFPYRYVYTFKREKEVDEEPVDATIGWTIGME